MFGLDRMFDRAKGVAIAAGAATLLGIAGGVSLAISASMTLALQMPAPAAYAVAGIGFLTLAAVAMWVGLQPKRPENQDEPKPVIDPAAAVLDMIDLPVNVATQVFRKRPVMASVAAAGLGLLLVRKPLIVLGVVEGLIGRRH